VNNILMKIPFNDFILFLMNGSADCVNAWIGEANISKLANSDHSTMFARENRLARKDFLHPLYNGEHY
jgi:hypothetical protein